MKWIDNTYCKDNGFFTSGIYTMVKTKRKSYYPAYYAGKDLGKFREIRDAKFAVEKAHEARTGEAKPVRYVTGRTGLRW